MTYKNIKVIIITAIICVLYTPIVKSAEKTIYLGNNDYLMSTSDEQTLTILDIENSKVFKKNFGFEIEMIELCSAYPLISFKRKNNTSRESMFYIYNIKKDKLYQDKHLFLDVDEKRWSNSGKYTYINKIHSFTIIETDMLEEYINQPKKGMLIEVTGHPLGAIWQIFWSGKYFIYASGIGETECFGLLDTENKQNYFISCCGFVDKNYFSEPCKKFKETNGIARSMYKLVKEKKCSKISNDFYQEILYQEILQKDNQKNQGQTLIR